MKKILKTLIPPLIWDKLGTYKQNIRAWMVGYDPKACMSMFYKDVLKKDMNWENPSNLIEKINWLQLNTDTSLWTICADKYKVREYIKGKGLGEILNELYGVWDRAEDIDWDKLPNQFVLKTTHGCGEVILVMDKSILNIKETIKKLNKWLKYKYGLLNGQTHYTRIKPCIIAEKFLLSPEEYSLIDYKIWCFSGNPECILVCYNRDIAIGKYSLSMYDTEWNNISEKALNRGSKHLCGNNLPKPKNFDTMLKIASALSNNFPEARVDLYNINGRIVFGELTFTTGYGSYNEEFYKYLGSKVVLAT